MHLDEARLLASGLVTAMRPLVERIVVVGSIRRCRFAWIPRPGRRREGEPPRRRG